MGQITLRGIEPIYSARIGVFGGDRSNNLLFANALSVRIPLDVLTLKVRSLSAG